MSSARSRLARRMTSAGGVVVALGTAATLATGTAVAATGTASAASATTAAAGAAAAEAKRPPVRTVRLAPVRPVLYPRGAALRTTRHHSKIYIKIVKRQRERLVKVRAITPGGRAMGPWVTVPSRNARPGRTVALTRNVRDGVPFKLQWAKSRAGAVAFYLYY
ncbi:hypothetical protein GCM10009678_48860 [Actinomadura kijaniata]|uniref:Secreted protein n=1 Tax=Actinomadura namibiensis TaxID=182080 RepID=A0A7W3QQB9_ACTNM|nr:hypothetical protein [Actinomadura namibiensis]MBA8955466.1 hypothetical protein [Actinomadura namibiensis]